MRPIDKGDWPHKNGRNVDFGEYRDARPYLLDYRIGDYCSYCENQITNPAVEHIQPKAVVPGLELNWYNFILGCINCNSTKGHDYINVDDYYWPDVHNTHLLFDFHPMGVVTLKVAYPPSIDAARAARTFDLTGLGRFGSNASVADRRWIKRSEAWGKAEDALDYYVTHGHPHDFIQIITNTATSTGFWSVWMAVFRSHAEVRDALILAYLGTFSGCQTTDIDRH